MMRVDWDQYGSKLKGATGTDIELLQWAVKGAVLDIGCGIGKHLAMLDNVVLKVGIDAGLASLQMGKLIFPDLTLICCSVYQLPFKSATFDSAVMIDVIEHLEDPSSALKEVVRLMKRDGTLYVQTPNYPIKRLYDLWHRLRGSRGEFRDDQTHVSKFNCRHLVSVVSQAGFKVGLVTARNVLFDKYFPAFRRLRNTAAGLILGQKVIIVAERTN